MHIRGTGFVDVQPQAVDRNDTSSSSIHSEIAEYHENHRYKLNGAFANQTNIIGIFN